MKGVEPRGQRISIYSRQSTIYVEAGGCHVGGLVGGEKRHQRGDDGDQPEGRLVDPEEHVVDVMFDEERLDEDDRPERPRQQHRARG